jgi:hypothetical protein
MNMSEKTNSKPDENILSEIERYVLDMGNRFSDAVRTDDTYNRTLDAVTTLEYDVAQLGRYTGTQDKVKELEGQHAEQEAQLRTRKLLLVELWEEAHGNEGVFTRLIRIEDLRAEIEADPEKTEILDEYREAQADLDAFRYQSGESYSSSE